MKELLRVAYAFDGGNGTIDENDTLSRVTACWSLLLVINILIAMTFPSSPCRC